MPHVIEVKRTLPDEFFCDIMVTMAESGFHAVRYWGRITDIDRDEKLNITRLVIRDGVDDFGSEDDDSDHAEATLTPEVVAAAMQKILRDLPVNPDITDAIARAVAEEDAGEIDATAADCIAQIAVLDEITYG